MQVFEEPTSRGPNSVTDYMTATTRRKPINARTSFGSYHHHALVRFTTARQKLQPLTLLVT
jgi:hypothetical protein